MNTFTRIVREITKKDRKSLQQRAMKLAEEAGETNAAILQYKGAHGTDYKPNVDEKDIAAEAVDTIIVATSILCDLQLEDKEIKSIVEKKLFKWKKVLGLFDKNCPKCKGLGKYSPYDEQQTEPSDIRICTCDQLHVRKKDG